MGFISTAHENETVHSHLNSNLCSHLRIKEIEKI